MFKIESRELSTISPKEAAELLKWNTYVSQRGLRQSHVITLASAIEKGEFHTGEVVIAVSDGKAYLLNGQHQLNAVLLTGMPIKALLVRASCPTKEDLSRLFAQFDVNATRSIKDIVGAEIDSMDVNWGYRTASLLATAIHYLQNKKAISKYEKATAIRRFVKEGSFIDQFISNDTALLKRGPAVAAMITTFWKDEKGAHEFWSGVAFGEMLEKNDARLKLRTYLIGSGLGASGSRREMYAKCITAWNAWRKGASTALKYHADKSAPVAI